MTKALATSTALIALLLIVACADSGGAPPGYSYVGVGDGAPVSDNQSTYAAGQGGTSPTTLPSATAVTQPSPTPTLTPSPTPTPSPSPTAPSPPVFVLSPVTTNQNTAAPAPLNFISVQQPNACIDITNAAPAANLKLGYWYCNGVGPAQAWLSGSGILQSAGPYCLGIANNETLTAGAHPTLQTCSSNGTGIFWQWSNGHLQVTNTNLCVTQLRQVGTQVELHTCDFNDTAQNWALGSNDGNTTSGIMLRNQVAGVCLDSQSPNALRVTTCDGTVPQQWLWEAGTIRTATRCLSVGADDNTVQVATCSGALTQNWMLRGNSIINAFTGTCLAPTATPVSGASTPVTMQPCAPQVQQTWVLGGTN